MTDQLNRSILFLSAIDFKDKSIKVIKITPSFYAKKGWSVHYIVARNESIYDNYFYENIINPDSVVVERFIYPFKKIIDKQRNKWIRVSVQKLSNICVVFLLAMKGFQHVKKEQVDLIYGYEVQGVLAANIIKLLFILRKNITIVSRFQGTHITNYINNKRWSKILTNLDHIIALYLPSDLCIMTNDGTQGIEALKKIRSRNLKNCKFWINGVDNQKLACGIIEKHKTKPGIVDELIFVSVSRLEKWKHVERCIYLINYIIKNFKMKKIKYYVIGDGSEKKNLENLAEILFLQNYIIFVGAIQQKEVKKYLNNADFFLSLYDVSNLGNPLWEAISANIVAITLKNGDTGKFIKHKENGLIYDYKICDTEKFYQLITNDINELLKNKIKIEEMKKNIEETAKQYLWSWEERMNAEFEEICKILN